MFRVNATMAARSGYLFGKILDAFRGVFNGKRFSENMAIAITEHHNMILFGVIDWHAHNFFIVSGFFKHTKQLLTLVYINVFLFHGEAPFLFLQLLHCRLLLNYATGISGWLINNGASPTLC